MWDATLHCHLTYHISSSLWIVTNNSLIKSLCLGCFHSGKPEYPLLETRLHQALLFFLISNPDIFNRCRGKKGFCPVWHEAQTATVNLTRMQLSRGFRQRIFKETREIGSDIVPCPGDIFEYHNQNSNVLSYSLLTVFIVSG